MFNAIKVYLQTRRTKKLLYKIFQLLYSEKKFTTADDLLKRLRPKSEFQKLEYYILMEFAAKLNRPFTDDMLILLYNEQVTAFNFFRSSDEFRYNIMLLEKSKANISMITFNYEMDNLRNAYAFNEYSPGGMKFSKLISKGEPLTESEEIVIRKTAEEIKRLDEISKVKLKEYEEAIKKS